MVMYEFINFEFILSLWSCWIVFIMLYTSCEAIIRLILGGWSDDLLFMMLIVL